MHLGRRFTRRRIADQRRRPDSEGGGAQKIEPWKMVRVRPELIPWWPVVIDTAWAAAAD